MIRPRRISAVFALGVAALCGCDSGPALYPVTGTVTLPDGKPAAGSTIEFRAQSDANKGMNARGDVGADGTYTMFTRVGKDMKPGVVPGPHGVVIIPASPAVPTNMDSGTDPRPIPFPRRYMSYESSKLTYEVLPTAPNKYDVKLQAE